MENGEEDRELLTVAEVAEQLGYTPQHVRLLLRESKLSGTKIGRDWVVPVSAVQHFLAGRELLDLPFDEQNGPTT